MAEKGIGLDARLGGSIDTNARPVLVEPTSADNKVVGGSLDGLSSVGSVLSRVAAVAVVAVYVVALVAVELGIGSESMWMAFLTLFTLVVVGAIMHHECGGRR